MDKLSRQDIVDLVRISFRIFDEVDRDLGHLLLDYACTGDTHFLVRFHRRLVEIGLHQKADRLAKILAGMESLS